MKRRWFLLCGLTAAVLSAAACQPEEDESEEDTFQEFTEQKSAGEDHRRGALCVLSVFGGACHDCGRTQLSGGGRAGKCGGGSGFF